MKGVIALGLLCLLACSGFGQGSESKTDAIRSFSHLSRQVRSIPDNCKLECTGDKDNADIYIIQIDVGIYIYYCKSLNVFAIYNVDLAIAIIFHFNSGIVGVFNLNLGGALLINIKLGAVIFLAFDKQVVVDINGGLAIAIGVCVQFIAANIGKITGVIDFGAAFVFQISAFVQIAAGVSLQTIFNLKLELLAQIQASFSALILAIVQVGKCVTIDLQNGLLIVIAGVLKIVVGSATQLVLLAEIALAVCLEAKLQISAFFVYLIQIYGGVQASIEGALRNLMSLYFGIIAGIIVDIEGSIKLLVSGSVAFLADLKAATATVANIVYNILYYVKNGNFIFKFCAGAKGTLIVSLNVVKGYLAFAHLTSGRIVIYALKTGSIIVYNGLIGIGVVIQKGLVLTAYKCNSNASAIAAAYLSFEIDVFLNLIFDASLVKGIVVNISDLFKGIVADLELRAAFVIWVSAKLSVSILTTGAIAAALFIDVGLNIMAAGISTAVSTIVGLAVVTPTIILGISAALSKSFIACIQAGLSISFAFSISGSIG